jgi:hypothetical protein
MEKREGSVGIGVEHLILTVLEELFVTLIALLYMVGWLTLIAGMVIALVYGAIALHSGNYMEVMICQWAILLLAPAYKRYVR